MESGSSFFVSGMDNQKYPTHKSGNSNARTNVFAERLDHVLRQRLKISKLVTKASVQKRNNSSIQTNPNQKGRASRRRIRQGKTSAIERLLTEAREEIKQKRERKKDSNAGSDPISRSAAESAPMLSTANQPMKKYKKRLSKPNSKPDEKSGPVATQLALLAKLSSI